jgi:hypothetical protein
MSAGGGGRWQTCAVAVAGDQVRRALLRRRFALEYATLAWNVAGIVVLAIAAISARSVALAGFGLDSLIEIGASAVVIWELSGTGEERALALLHVLCVFRLLPDGFTNAVLRHHLAPPLGKDPGLMTSGQGRSPTTCGGPAARADRAHPAHLPVPGHRCRDALRQFLTRLHDRVLRTGLAQITDPDPPASTALRAADRTYQAAIDDIIRYAGLGRLTSTPLKATIPISKRRI